MRIRLTSLIFSGLTLFGFHSAAVAWTVDSIDGNVSVEKNGTTVKLDQDVEFVPGQTLITGPEASVTVKEDDNQIVLSPGTRFLFEKSADRGKKQLGVFKVLSGRAHLTVTTKESSKDYPYQFKTSSLTATTHGTEISVSAGGGASEDRIDALNGAARVVDNSNGGKTVEVTNGLEYYKAPDSPGATRFITPEENKVMPHHGGGSHH
jgi:hypothetical protein